MLKAFLICSLLIGLPNITYAHESGYTINSELYDFTNSGGAEKQREENIKQKIVDQLNRSGTLPSNMEIKGKVKNEDGTYSVAIMADEVESLKDPMTFTVNINENGFIQLEKLERFHLEKEADKETAQSIYDYVVNNNDMSEGQLETLNTHLHDEGLQGKLSKIAEEYNIPQDLVDKTAAGAISMVGLVLLGAGSKTKEEEERILAEEAAAAAKKKNYPKFSGSLLGGTPVSGFPKSLYGDGYTCMFPSCITDEQYEGMTMPTKMFLCRISTRFYNETGQIVYLTSGYRPYDTGSYHSQGIAFDVAGGCFDGADSKYYRDIYKAICLEMGGTPLDEYPGEPGEIYARGGSNFHISVHDQTWYMAS